MIYVFMVVSPLIDKIAGSNPSGAWISVSCECCVFSIKGLSDGPTPSPEESY